MKIKNHRLHEDDDTPVKFVESPNREGPLVPKFLVMHYTAGSSVAGAVSWLTNPNSKASAHLVIGREGEVTQLVPFNRVAWHAGSSAWKGLNGLNQFSIGIELDNAGKLAKDESGRWHSWFGKEYDPGEVIVATHKHQSQPAGWHIFTPKQIERALEIASVLVNHYDLEAVLGHEDISPGRKQDPGPAFPMASFQAHLLGRATDFAAPFGAVRTIPEKFAQVQNGQFRVEGRPFKFVGFNIRGLVHYGAPYDRGETFLKNSEEKHQREQLQGAFNLGARVIRVFLPHRHASPKEVGDRLENLLKLIHSQPFDGKVYLIPALTDFLGYGHVPFKVAGDEAANFYEHDAANFITLKREFFIEGYRQNYLPFVKYIVNRFKDEPNIFCWEIMNEGKVDNDPRLFIGFNHHVAREIKLLDPNHMVTTGMVSTAHAWMGHDNLEARRHLYQGEREGESRLIDFVTTHYPGECNALGCNHDDIQLAKELGLPVIVEENLIKPNPANEDRSPRFKRDMEMWFARGVSGYMTWGFDKVRVGDGELGGIGDPNQDWDQLARLFSEYCENELPKWI